MSDSTDHDDAAFAEAMKGVRRLEVERVDLHQQRPRPQPSPRPRPVLDPSPKTDARGIGHDIDSLDSYARPGLSKKLLKRLRAGKQPIDGVLDLHGYRQQQATQALDDFLQRAISEQASLVLIIHGKGFRSEHDAVLRPLVQRWLIEQPQVLAFCHAQPRHGGNGASYVYLKSAR